MSEPSHTPKSERPILVTGATGYVGGRLVSRLLARGFRVRCFARSLGKMEARPWAEDPRVELVEGDLQDREAVRRALNGCSAAYYLVHSMASAAGDFARMDRNIARQFATLAGECGIERILYLGGLGEDRDGLSEHLASRREVETELKTGPVPVTTLRAAVIIGSGSASFEMLRYLINRLPVMITPRWVATPCQPIGIRDVLGDLVGCLETPETTGQTYDIGGDTVLSYRELMQLTAQEMGLGRRLVIPVPVLTPALSSRWIHLVTPISKDIARPLIDGLKNPVVCHDTRIRDVLPRRRLSAGEAIRRAIGRYQAGDVPTRWSDAGVMPGDPDWSGGTLYEDPYQTSTNAQPSQLWKAVTRIGGRNGYYGSGWLWWLRGLMDQLVGGPGLRRGRRHPEELGFGEALDFWRVTDLKHERLLELRAEMLLPGVATLTFELEGPDEHGRTLLRQTARFQPRGLAGHAYWFAVLPLHGLVFPKMQRGIQRYAEAASQE